MEPLVLVEYKPNQNSSVDKLFEEISNILKIADFDKSLAVTYSNGVTYDIMYIQESVDDNITFALNNPLLFRTLNMKKIQKILFKTRRSQAEALING